jgi:DNA modification methylase
LSLANAGFDVGFTPIYWTYHNGYPKPHHTSKSIEQNAKDSIDLASKYQGSTMGLQLKPSIEHIIIGMKPHGEKSFIKNLIEFEKLPDNIKATCPFIQVPKPNKKEKNLSFSWQSQITINNHPSVKPVKLMSYLIQLFTREGDIVLDPYMGSATSGVSAKLTNRHFIGVEMDVDYFDTCLKRISVPRKDLIEFFKKLK